MCSAPGPTATSPSTSPDNPTTFAQQGATGAQTEDIRAMASFPDAAKACLRVIFVTGLLFLMVRGEEAKGEHTLEEKLMNACAQGDAEDVQVLLREGVNVNHQSPEGETPLHLSSIAAANDVAKLLIKHGADVNKRAHGAHSLAMAPLHWFLFMKGCTDGVQALIDAGANVNDICWTEQGGFLTPLDIAVKLGDSREKEKAMLLAKGAKQYDDMTEQERSDHAPPPNSGPPHAK